MNKHKKIEKMIEEYDLEEVIKFLNRHKKSRWLKLINRIINNKYYDEYGMLLP